jgi:hypothetical protein
MKKLPLLLLLPAVFSNAANFDANVGISRYMHADDGFWYLSMFDHSLKLTAPAVDIGVSGNVVDYGNSGLDWRVGAVYLGSAKSNAAIPSPFSNTKQGKFVGQDFIGAHPKTPCHGKCTKMSQFDGSGHEFGVTIAAQPYYKYNDYKISGIAGVFIHKSTWSENVKDLYNPDETKYSTVVETDKKFRFGTVLGASVTKNDFVFKYQYLFMPPNNTGLYPPIWRGAHVVSVGYQF